MSKSQLEARIQELETVTGTNRTVHIVLRDEVKNGPMGLLLPMTKK